MTNEEKRSLVRTMIGTNESDEVLSTYLTLASTKILLRLYPYKAEIEVIPTRYENLQCEIAACLINKRGAEGQTVHSENGIARTYGSADIPEDMLKGVTAYCGVIL